MHALTICAFQIGTHTHIPIVLSPLPPSPSFLPRLFPFFSSFLPLSFILHPVFPPLTPPFLLLPSLFHLSSLPPSAPSLPLQVSWRWSPVQVLLLLGSGVESARHLLQGGWETMSWLHDQGMDADSSVLSREHHISEFSNQTMFWFQIKCAWIGYTNFRFVDTVGFSPTWTNTANDEKLMLKYMYCKFPKMRPLQANAFPSF